VTAGAPEAPPLHGEAITHPALSADKHEELVWKERLVVLTSTELVLAALGTSGPEGPAYFEGEGFRSLGEEGRAKILSTRVGGGNALGVCGLERLTGISCGEYSSAVPQEELTKVRHIVSAPKAIARHQSVHFRHDSNRPDMAQGKVAESLRNLKKGLSRTLSSAVGYVQNKNGASGQERNHDPRVLTLYVAPLQDGRASAGAGSSWGLSCVAYDERGEAATGALTLRPDIA
jgi:hypothetical protein